MMSRSFAAYDAAKKAARLGKAKQAHGGDEKHLAFVRAQECCLPFCHRQAEPAHTASRKAVHEMLHGKAKANSARAANAALGRGEKDVNADSAFTSDTADKTGKAVRTVQVDAKRGSGIGADVLGWNIAR
jgi:hypothetical protein